MALSVDLFLASFPEFSSINDGVLIEAKLEEAANNINAEIFNQFVFDMLHGYLTAHLLSTSPSGQQARLSASSGETTYYKMYRENLFRHTVASGLIVDG